MCGGKGIRIKSSIDPNLEKPLVKINNKPLVEYLINTLIQTNRFEKIFAAVSGNTCRTREYLKIKFHNKITLLETSGVGYSNDYTKMIRYFTNVWNKRKMGLGRILFLPIDIPLISSMLLNQIMDMNQKKPCLAIVLEKDYIQKHGLLPTEYELMIDKKKTLLFGYIYD
jgi:adenosylcobinamide-phosphate guanylyltransferase